MASNYQKGLMGEELAEKYMAKKGYEPVQRRFKTLFGEIDLIMKKGNQFVFVEVKFRPGQLKGYGAEAVNKRKQEKVLLAVQEYVIRQHLENTPLRIDVIEITKDGIWHIENAF